MALSRIVGVWDKNAGDSVRGLAPTAGINHHFITMIRAQRWP